jgi:hypothetical protein
MVQEDGTNMWVEMSWRDLSIVMLMSWIQQRQVRLYDKVTGRGGVHPTAATRQNHLFEAVLQPE